VVDGSGRPGPQAHLPRGTAVALNVVNPTLAAPPW
jgi:hypothetical protein